MPVPLTIAMRDFRAKPLWYSTLPIPSPLNPSSLLLSLPLTATARSYNLTYTPHFAPLMIIHFLLLAIAVLLSPLLGVAASPLFSPLLTSNPTALSESILAIHT